MMKIVRYILVLFLLLAAASCNRDLVETDFADEALCLPEGVPTTLVIPFGGTDMYEVEVSTKAASSAADEARIHDLYVFIFDNNNLTESGSPRKIYGRYFSYDHQKRTLADVVTDDNECWYVENVTIDGSVSETKGAVKVSTITCSDAKLVVIANLENSVTLMDGIEGLDRLNSVLHYDELRGIKVSLEQDVVNRMDLFLMTGERSVNTREMSWGSIVDDTPEYSSHTVTLRPVDAKVKFRVKVNPTYISAVTPVYWQVCNTPESCYLYSDYDGGAAPKDASYFQSQQYYFEGTETVADETYYVFTFYMLENRETPNNDSATNYYQRELREKIDSGDPGYNGPSGPGNEAFSNHYVDNGDWLFAPTYGTYVRFDMVLTLTEKGIENVSPANPEGMTITQALTSDAIFTVHLGDFASSSEDDTNKLNDYNTLRSNSYTYTITVNNTSNIYTEVMRDEERQSGQEGYLLLTDTEIINADCHYEYHQIEFPYRPDMSQDIFSWYVKTPFSEGGPVIHKDGGNYTYDATGLDYKWVKFSVNHLVPSDYSAEGDATPDAEPWHSDTEGLVRPYTKKRHAYPGDSHYHPEWTPGTPNLSTHAHMVTDDDGETWKAVPDLMDITQLIQYVFYQTRLEATTGDSAFIADDSEKEDDQEPVIRLTAFIDEYYYDSDPLNPGAPLDPDIWRKFVNANPREMHILSDAQRSRDRKSDVILSSHSIIQQSIQTIYNIYSPTLHSLWGTEHRDEMRRKSQDGWMYWPKNLPDERSGSFNTMVGKENGRLNSAYIWGFYSSKDTSGEDYTGPEIPEEDKTLEWGTYLNYDVHNNTPELNEDYWGMAWSCLTRNRDNNGNGKVDRDEVRWYLAASNQLIGMWVGNESLSVNARLYRPEQGQWRAHILSSSEKRVSWAEEGGGASEYSLESNQECWGSLEAAARGESVRCLRNIGTYMDGGVRKDITGAQYTVAPERYFTITPEPDNDLTKVDNPSTHYTISFDRINPKSLREYTDNDLPFSDQFSINNCVYLQIETQSREDERLLMDSEGNAYANYPYPYNLSLADVNMEIGRLGMNPYCPPGYRFPNQSEMLMMSVYLPQSYFLKDAGGSNYDKTVWMPTRTYFDRGHFGRNVAGFEYDNEGESTATNREQCKVGWAYTVDAKKNRAARIKTPEYGPSVTHYMKRSRCVRDIDHTGDITGGLLIKNELYPGDDVPITFSFNSSGSTFVSASLKFCYTDGSGTYHERDIPIQTTPSGLQFLADQTFTIPSISALGLTQEQLDADNGALRKKTKFKITIRNAFSSKTFEQPFVLGNPLTDISLTLKGDDGYEDELYPGAGKTVDIDFSSNANSCKLHRMSVGLEYTDKNGATQTVSASSLGFPAFTADASVEYKYQNRELSIPDLGTGSGQMNFNPADLDDDEKNSAVFVVTVEDAGGSSFTQRFSAKLANPLIFEVIGNQYIYPNEVNPVTLSARTKSSGTLNNVEVRLSYDEENINLIPATDPGKRTYGADPDIDFSGKPLSLLNLLPSALTIHGDNPIPYKVMNLIAEVSDSNGFTKTIERELRLRSHIDVMSLEFPSEYDNDKGVPITVSASLVDGKTATYSASFDYRSYSGAWTSWQTWSAGTTAASNATKYTTDMAGVSAVSDVVGENINKTYSYRFTVNCDDGTSFTKTRSMQLLRFNYSPNGAQWTDTATNMDLSRGDVIEAQIEMVITAKKAGLLSIGNNINDWSGNGVYVFHFYMGDTTSERKFRSACSSNKTVVGRGDRSHPNAEVNIVLNKSGLFVDGKEGNNSGGFCYWDKNDGTYRGMVNHISNNVSSFQIGQQEGGTRSGSLYHYIRVIRDTEIPAP